MDIGSPGSSQSRERGRVGLKPAVFLDKDGTLIHDLPFNVDPAMIRLRAGAGPTLARLAAAGYALVLVSNQSGVALGRFAEADLTPVWQCIRNLLSPHGVGLDGIYYCPHHPEGSKPGYRQDCNCRKPRPGLLFRAAAELGLDLSRSWLVGDILDDVEAGRQAGCRTVLLDVGSETEWRLGPRRYPHRRAASLAAAAGHILAERPDPVPA